MRGQEIITKTDSLYFRGKIRKEKFNASTNGSLKPTNIFIVCIYLIRFLAFLLQRGKKLLFIYATNMNQHELPPEYHSYNS